MEYMKRLGAVLVGVVAVLAVVVEASAWSGPTANPPSGNVAAPINVGSASQTKNGSLGVNGLAVFGNSLLQASSYLNWGAVAGVNGYGIRDNAGTLEFKNSGGSWASLQSIVYGLMGGGGSWAASGSNIYNSNAGNVGINTSNPQQKLDVNGYVRVDSVNGEGGTIQLMGNNGTNIYLENLNGTFRLVNSPWTAQLFYVDQSGNTVAAGNVYVGAIGLWASQLRLSQQLGGTFSITVGGCGGGSTLRCDSYGAIQVGSSVSTVQCSQGCSPWNTGGCQTSYSPATVYTAYCRAILY